MPNALCNNVYLKSGISNFPHQNVWSNRILHCYTQWTYLNTLQQTYYWQMRNFLSWNIVSYEKQKHWYKISDVSDFSSLFLDLDCCINKFVTSLVYKLSDVCIYVHKFFIHSLEEQFLLIVQSIHDLNDALKQCHTHINELLYSIFFTHENNFLTKLGRIYFKS